MRLARSARLILLFLAWALAAGVFTQTSAHAQGAPPAAHDDAAFDVMNLLSHRGLHDVDNESWNVYGQFTYISSFKPRFPAAYTNLNGTVGSLLPDPEHSFTGTLTLFVGKRLWRGGELYFVPEAITERPFSSLHGLGGAIQNFELQKTGAETPQIYRARLFLRQRFDLGGERVVKTSDPMQLGATVTSRRLVLTAGNFTVLDMFDHNNVTGDPRQTFLNMNFMTHSSWDFAADARGYSWGAAAELFWDDWAIRFSRMAPPKDPNALPTDLHIWNTYADALEVEHDHAIWNRAGAIRLLGYRNVEITGRFDDAIAAFRADPTKNAAACTSYNYGSGNSSAPDLCWVRRQNQKVGLGVDVEQYIAQDVGLFARAMYADGLTEVDAFDPADRSFHLGSVAKGTLWNRPFDVTGIGIGFSWISAIHAQYLDLGGVDAFVGDGKIQPAAESVFDVFYSVNFLKAVWLTGDYQFIRNPGFNADRGPAHIFGGRVHAEF